MTGFEYGFNSRGERLLHYPPTKTQAPMSVIRLLLIGLWFWTACSLLGRIHLVFSYETIATLPTFLEPFGAPTLGLLLCLLLAISYFLLDRHSSDRHPVGPHPSVDFTTKLFSTAVTCCYSAPLLQPSSR